MWLAKVDVTVWFGGMVVIGAFGVLGALLSGVSRFVRRLLNPAARHTRPTPRQPAVRLCPQSRCGHMNVGEARYCARCGRPLLPLTSSDSHG